MTITTKGLPTFCEFCESELTWDGVNLVCSNPNCGNVADEQLKAWITSIAPIEGIGWKTIKKYLDTSPFILFPIDSIEDLYKVVNNPLARNRNTKLNSEADLFNKVLDKLSGPITVSQFLLALKIPGLGKVGANKAENFGNIREAFNSVLNYKDGKDWCGDQNIWSKLLQDTNTAHSLYTTYNDRFKYCYNIVKEQIVFNSSNKNNTENKGTVVLTGALSVKRDIFVTELENRGWKVSSKINKDTKYLITNTPESGTSKNKEAEKFGVTKITEEEFRKVM